MFTDMFTCINPIAATALVWHLCLLRVKKDYSGSERFASKRQRMYNALLQYCIISVFQYCSITVLQYYNITVLHYYSITISQYHSIIVLHDYGFIVLQCYSVT
ncbi:MAG: hypothetical protein ACKPKO_34135, partial [Candidatus Fonsibacter sp.]